MVKKQHFNKCFSLMDLCIFKFLDSFFSELAWENVFKKKKHGATIFVWFGGGGGWRSAVS